MAMKISHDDILQMIKGQINLPSPPAIAVQILNTVQANDSSMSDLEKIIAADPALTGKMLRIANSAFYSLPFEITNINRALSILGTNVIKNIALSFVVASELQSDAKTSYFDFDYFWRRSVTSAVAAELIMKTTKEKDDDIFVTALLQDIGVLVMYLTKGSEYANTLKSCRIHGGSGLIQSERNSYQFDHQLLGYVLLENWNIPSTITQPLRYHHEPDKAPVEYRRSATVLYLANLLSAIYSGKETAQNVRILQNKMDELFDIPPATTRELLDDVAKKSIDIIQIFDIDPGEIRPYSLMLQEANDELGKLNLSYEQLVMELKESKEKAEQFANDLREANAKLEELAFRDGLTGLYNHRYFQEHLSRELARAKRYNLNLSLIIFDIDYFKKVNDTFGHPAGDKVLINLADIVSKTIRPCDIIARYGGEEFAVILPETNRTGLSYFAERLRKTAGALATSIQGAHIQVTISCGGAHVAIGQDVTKQDLIDAADRGLYQSKANGRNCVTIQPLITHPS